MKRFLPVTASPPPSPAPARGSAMGTERRHQGLCRMLIPYRARVGSAKESVALTQRRPWGLMVVVGLATMTYKFRFEEDGEAELYGS